MKHTNKCISRKEESKSIPCKDKIPPQDVDVDDDEELTGPPVMISGHQINKQKNKGMETKGEANVYHDHKQATSNQNQKAAHKQ